MTYDSPSNTEQQAPPGDAPDNSPFNKDEKPTLAEFNELVKSLKRREAKLAEKNVVLRNKFEDITVRVERLEKRLCLHEKRTEESRSTINIPLSIALLSLVVALGSVLMNIL